MGVTQLGWTTPYSLLDNYISDLGAAHCGLVSMAPSRYVCSPWHEVFDVSIIVLGLLLIAGLVLLHGQLARGVRRELGTAMLLLAAAGAMGVGFSPEDVNLTVHLSSAFTAFLLGNLGITVLGLAIGRTFGRRWVVPASVVLTLVGLGAIGVYLTKSWGALGPGGTERLVLAPILLWSALMGLLLLRGPAPVVGMGTPETAAVPV